MKLLLGLLILSTVSAFASEDCHLRITRRGKASSDIMHSGSVMVKANQICDYTRDYKVNLSLDECIEQGRKEGEEIALHESIINGKTVIVVKHKEMKAENVTFNFTK